MNHYGESSVNYNDVETYGKFASTFNKCFQIGIFQLQFFASEKQDLHLKISYKWYFII